MDCLQGWTAASLGTQNGEDENDRLKELLAEHPDADLKVAFTITDDVDEFAIPFRKGESRLVEAVDIALDELKADGTLSSISQKYFI